MTSRRSKPESKPQSQPRSQSEPKPANRAGSPNQPATSNRAALATVFLVVMIDLLGFGIVLPLLPFYAKEFAATPLTIGLLYSVYSFMQLIFSPFWGGLSDRIGRRPIMLLSTFGASMAYLLFGFAETLGVLFLSRILAGGMGGNISTAQAYIADVTTKEDRARGMGLIGAAFGIGFVIGPASATLMIHPAFHGFIGSLGAEQLAVWMSDHRFALPGFFASFLSLCSFLMVMLKLPETVAVPRGAGLGEVIGLGIGAKTGDVEGAGTGESNGDVEGAGIGESTGISEGADAGTDTGDRPGTRASARAGVFTLRFWRRLLDTTETSNGIPLLLLLMIAFFLLSFGESSLYSAFPLFASELLNLTAEQVGVQFFFIGIIAVIIQGFLIKPLTNRFPEERIFMVGNGLMVIGLAVIPLAGSMTQLAVALSVMAIGKSLNTPTMTSLISQQADESDVGAVMGTAQGLSGLGRMIGPSWGGAMFAIAYAIPFVATAAIVSGTIWIGYRLVRASAKSATA